MITDEAVTAYLDGEADAGTFRGVEAAMAGDPAFAARVRGMARRDDDVRRSFNRLLDRPASPRLVQAVRGGNVIPYPTRRAPRPDRRVWIGAAIAAQAAVLAGAVVLIHPVQAPPPATTPGYVALAAPPVVLRANVMLMFDPDTREADVRETLGAVEGRIVGGPTPAGAWMAHVPEARRDAVLVRLRASRAVTLAEAVDAR